MNVCMYVCMRHLYYGRVSFALQVSGLGEEQPVYETLTVKSVPGGVVPAGVELVRRTVYRRALWIVDHACVTYQHLEGMKNFSSDK